MSRTLPAVKMATIDTLTRYACAGIDGRNWYRDATAGIGYVADQEKWDADEFAGVLATTSPRVSVLRNIRLSLHFMHNRNLRVVPMRGIRRSVQHFLDCREIRGQKTRSFYHNLMGCPDHVTLDVWMAYALGIDQTDFNTVASRAKATDRVVTVARKMSVTPAEAQAMIWTGYRRRAGYQPSPFSVASEYFAARESGWDIPGCSLHAE